jgi:hypothetical protein
VGGVKGAVRVNMGGLRGSKEGMAEEAVLLLFLLTLHLGGVLGGRGRVTIV